MATIEQTLNIKIRKEKDNPSRCIVEDVFVANTGSTVNFQFEEQKNALIQFLGDSPFDDPQFPPGPQKVRKDARVGGYGYKITWANGGMGSSGGEVRHSGQVAQKTK